MTIRNFLTTNTGGLSSKGSNIRVVIAIALLAIIVRSPLLFVAAKHPERILAPDTSTYVIPAINLLDGNGFAGGMEAPFSPTAHRTPIYPLFIAGLFSLFGRELITVSLVQIFLDTVSVVMTYYLGRSLLSEPASIFGAVFMAISLDSAIHSILILSETMFTFLFLGSVTSLVVYKASGQTRWIVASGVLTALAILTRPIAIFWPLVGLLIIFMAAPFIEKQRAKQALVYLAVVAMALSPWLIRNQVSLGKTTITTLTGSQQLRYNAAALEADIRGISPAEAKASLEEQANEELRIRGWMGNEVLRSDFYAELGKKIILSDPVRYVVIHLRGDLNALLPGITYLYELFGFTQGGTGALSVLNSQGLLAAVQHYFSNQLWLVWVALPFIAILAMMYLGAATHAGLLIRHRNWKVFAILVSPIAYLLIMPGPPSNPRFRVPAMPYICLLAGAGLIFLWNSYKQKRLNSVASESI